MVAWSFEIPRCRPIRTRRGSSTMGLAILNRGMPKCSSQNRCLSTSCNPCSRRYASRLARCVLSRGPRRLYAVEIETTIPSPCGFGRWRTAFRNVVDYHRRGSRYWNDLGTWLWLSGDGRVQGVASLGSVTEAEFIAAVGRRWPTTLRLINPQRLRDEIIAVVRPGVIHPGSGAGRYQSIRTAIWPRRKPTLGGPPPLLVSNRYLKPMPILM
jgi:hypothetical protein